MTAAGIRRYTTAKERKVIAQEHGVKSRSQLSRILAGKSVNVPLLKALVARAEANEQEQKTLEVRAEALGK